jgi:hypothetical protein
MVAGTKKPSGKNQEGAERVWEDTEQAPLIAQTGR